MRGILCLSGLLLILAGCGQGENRKIFEQAGKDLEQGSYAYALTGFQTSAASQYEPALSWRGAGICHLRLNDAPTAVSDFTMALSYGQISLSLKKDLLSYKAAAHLAAGQPDAALADCREITSLMEPDADTFALTGQTLLSMDAYEEAASNFSQAWQADPTYDRAIQIYELYVGHGMEADGTRYLESALQAAPSGREDHEDRGRVYYYMQDYDQARSELIQAQKEGSTEAILLLGMVYLKKQDYSNARAMYIQYNSAHPSSAAGYNGLTMCDLAEENFASALQNIAAGIPLADPGELQSLLHNEIVVYERQLDFATAGQKAAEYLEAFPDDEQMQRELIFLQSRTQL